MLNRKIRFVLGFICLVSALASADSIPISGGVAAGFDQTLGTVNITGPDLSLNKTTPDGNNNIGTCVAGTVCNFSFTIGPYCTNCLNGSAYSGGNFGGIVANILAPDLTVSGTAFYSGGSQILQVPITIAGEVFGYQQTCSGSDCQLGNLLFSFDINGTGTADFTINSVGSLGVVYGGSGSFTGVATPLATTPEAPTLLLTLFGMATLWLGFRRSAASTGGLRS